MLKKTIRFCIASTLVSGLAVANANAEIACGGKLSSFLEGVKNEAVANGIPLNIAKSALRGTAIDRKVLSRDRAQGVFKQTFLKFSSRSVSSNRLNVGRKKIKQYKNTFALAKKKYGVPAPVIAAFWGLETDFGAVQGNFNTLNALVTLAHDCRRPELFRPQLLAALKMVQDGNLSPRKTTGAWAGEIGQVQMLPADIVKFGMDGDGDGRVNLKKSSPDAILTAARFIKHLGWKKNQPWIMEVKVPKSLRWENTGLGKAQTVSQWANAGVRARNGKLPSGKLPAALLLPQGRKGPAFLAFENFNIYLEWNQSFIYTTSAAYFATRIGGASKYHAGKPEIGLNDGQMKLLQKKLAKRGHDVGKIDGILGSGTRSAVQKEQSRLGLPADAWPTKALLSRL